jgi:hypothetical protein
MAAHHLFLFYFKPGMKTKQILSKNLTEMFSLFAISTIATGV